MADQGFLPENISEIIEKTKLDSRLISSIERYAKDALSDFPSKTQSSKLSKNDRIFIDRWRAVLQTGSKLNALSISKRNRFLKDILLLNAVQKTIVLKKPSGGGGGDAEKTCLQKYNECMSELNCEEKVPCLCCIPCGILYGRCIWNGLTIGEGAEYIESPDMEFVLT